ncbi:MAG: hypothetical protein MUO18_01245 [Methanomassiliicoccales archaeon]|nr:hypothetical protein [Methanomassiliicoccales archaeon]
MNAEYVGKKTEKTVKAQMSGLSDRRVMFATLFKAFGALLAIFGVALLLNDSLYLYTGHRLVW